MKPNNCKRRGTISVLTVIVVFSLVSIGAVLLSLSTAHSKATSGHQLRLRTLLIAGAGVHAAVAEINGNLDQNGDGLGTLPVTTYDSGTYQVTAVFDAAKDEYTIVSVGNLAGIQRTLEAVVKKPWYPIFRFGLFGDRQMTVLDGTLTDSIDSSLALAVEQQQPTREGDVGSNGPVVVQPGLAPATINGDLFSSAAHRDLIPSSGAQAIGTAGELRVTGDVRTGFGSINLSGGATVNGNVTTGEGSINASGATVGGLSDTNGPPVPDLDFSELYQGVQAAMSQYGGGAFNDAPFAVAPAPSGGAKVTVAAGETLTLGPGSHSFASLDVRGTLVVTGDASIGVSGNFIVRDGGSVVLQGTTQLDAAKVLMYGTGSSLVAEKPLTMRSLGSLPEVRLAGNLTFKDAATLASNGDIIGMDLASVTFQKEATLAAQGMMEFKSGATYTFNGDATVDAKGTVVWKENSTVQFNGKTVIDADVVDVRLTSTVQFNGPDNRVFAKSHLEVKADTTLSASKPVNLWWYAHGSAPTVDLKENGKFYGGLVVPHGDVDIKTGLEIYGAAQGKTVTFRTGAKLHYDLAFGRLTDYQDLKYRLISWRETGN